MADLESMDNLHLQRLLEEYNRKNEHLRIENDVFQSYLRRHAKPEELEDALDDDTLGKRGNKKMGLKSMTSTRAGASLTSSSPTKGGGGKLRGPTQVTHEQKVEIANAEFEAAKVDTQEAIKQGESVVETLQAMGSLADVRLVDVKREAYEFKRDVVLAGEDALTGKVPAEKVVKFYEDRLRAQDVIVDKLRVKNVALRQALVKAQEALKGKEAAGGVLHYIDFHQLQIENAQHLSKIEEKNGDLLRLKLTTGNTVSSLNELKGRLGELTKEATKLRRDIKARTTLLSKLRLENDDIAEQVSVQQETVAKLTAAARGAADMPQTIDYVEMTRTQAAIEHEIASWARKVEIAELTSTRPRRSRHATTMSGAGHGDYNQQQQQHGTPASGSVVDDRVATSNTFPSGFGRTMNSSFFGSTSNGVFTPAGNDNGGGGGSGGSDDGGGSSGAPGSARTHMHPGARGFSAGATVTGAAMRTPATGYGASSPAGVGVFSSPSSSAGGGILGAGGFMQTPGGSSSASSTAAGATSRGTSALGGNGIPPASAAAAAAAAYFGMPNLKVPVGFGSTTLVQGVSGTRPMGAIAASVKTNAKGFREAAFVPPRGVGGFGGGVTSHTTGANLIGQLKTGRPPAGQGAIGAGAAGHQ